MKKQNDINMQGKKTNRKNSLTKEGLEYLKKYKKFPSRTGV